MVYFWSFRSLMLDFRFSIMQRTKMEFRQLPHFVWLFLPTSLRSYTMRYLILVSLFKEFGNVSVPKIIITKIDRNLTKIGFETSWIQSFDVNIDRFLLKICLNFAQVNMNASLTPSGFISRKSLIYHDPRLSKHHARLQNFFYPTFF